MYNIQLSPSPSFNTNVASKLPQTGWIFNPGTPYNIYSFIGLPMPADLTIQSFIKDYILSMGTATYTDYYVEMIIVNPVVNGAGVPMFTASGPIADASSPGYHLTRNNLNVNTVLDFNFVNFPRGLYRCDILFLVKGKIEEYFYETVDQVRYIVNLTRLNYGDIHMAPEGAVELHYLLGSGSLPSKTQSLFVNGAFTVSVGDHIALSGGNLVLISDVGGIKTYSGSNNQNIVITLENSINAVLDPGTLYETEALFSTPTMVLSVTIKAHLYNATNNRVFPDTLSFTAVKGVTEADYKNFTIEGFGNYTITAPNWLALDGSNSGSNTTTRRIKPVHSDNLNPGVYRGQIKVVLGGADYFIDVQHNVIDSLQTGFSKTDVNFTKDRNGISTIYGADNTKLEIQMSVESFDYNATTTKIFPANFTKGIFNGISDFWLGNVVHKAMRHLKALSDINLENLQVPGGMVDLYNYKVFKYYNPSKIYFLFKYLNRVTGDQVGPSREFFNIQFLRGRKPARMARNFGIVDFKESPIRVTKKSFTLLPVFRNHSFSLIEIYRNGELYKRIYPNREDHQLFGVQLSFAPFQQGDVIEARVKGAPSELVSFSQLYIVFPPGKKSYHIVWENEHGTPEAFEFTGDYTFPSEHKGILSLSFDNYLEYTEKMASQRLLRFTANTGWILKSNQERIDSLVDSNRAWIVFNDSRPPIALVPEDAKLTNIDSAAQTYQYTIEFKINPQHELENNSF